VRWNRFSSDRVSHNIPFMEDKPMPLTLVMTLAAFQIKQTIGH
jgi:hypothetical protein